MKDDPQSSNLWPHKGRQDFSRVFEDEMALEPRSLEPKWLSLMEPFAQETCLITRQLQALIKAVFFIGPVHPWGGGAMGAIGPQGSIRAP